MPDVTPRRPLRRKTVTLAMMTSTTIPKATRSLSSIVTGTTSKTTSTSTMTTPFSSPVSRASSWSRRPGVGAHGWMTLTSLTGPSPRSGSDTLRLLADRPSRRLCLYPLVALTRPWVWTGLPTLRHPRVASDIEIHRALRVRLQDRWASACRAGGLRSPCLYPRGDWMG